MMCTTLPLFSRICDVRTLWRAWGKVKEKGSAGGIDDFVVLCRSRQEAFQAFNDADHFLRDRLRLRLNTEDQAYRHVSSGFEFLGFFFKDKKKTVSERKIAGIQDRIVHILNEHSGAGLKECMTRLNESITGWRQYYMMGDTAEQFQFLDNILFYKLSAHLKRSLARRVTTAVLRGAIYGLEFFLPRSQNDRQRLLELMIAHAKMAPKEVTSKKSATPTDHPLPVAAAVAGKKQSYQTLLCKDSDLVAALPGSLIVKNSRWLLVIRKGKKIMRMPLFRLKGLIVIAEGVNLSTHIIQYCSQHRIPIHFIDRRGKLYAALASPFPPAAGSPSPSTPLAITLVQGKLKNQVNLLNHFRSQDRIELEFKQACERAVTEIGDILNQVEGFSGQCLVPQQAKKLFRLQGAAYACYWRAVRGLLARYVYFEGRERNPVCNPVNSMLNFGTGILFSKVVSLAASAGLDRLNSFFSVIPGKRSSPAWELSALFRQLVVDRLVFDMLRRSEKVEMTGLFLSCETRKKIALSVLRKLQDKTRFQDRLLSYIDIIAEQAQNLKGSIETGAAFVPFVQQYTL